MMDVNPWIPNVVSFPPTKGQGLEVLIDGKITLATYIQGHGFMENGKELKNVTHWRPKRC